MDTQTAVLVSTAEVWISAPDTQTPIFLGFLGIHSWLWFFYREPKSLGYFPEVPVTKIRVSAPAPYKNPTVIRCLESRDSNHGSLAVLMITSRLASESNSVIWNLSQKWKTSKALTAIQTVLGLAIRCEPVAVSNRCELRTAMQEIKFVTANALPTGSPAQRALPKGPAAQKRQRRVVILLCHHHFYYSLATAKRASIPVNTRKW